jgi:MFS transporter, NNP family, nitrate/nitrite transporter
MSHSEYAWRFVSIVPALVAFCTGITIFYISDDFPKGNAAELKANGVRPEKHISTSFHAASTNINTWLLFIQYAACFGVELTMNAAAASYFKDEFGVSTESAAAVASIFGWMNLFARGLGGFVSDLANARFGMRGRLYTNAFILGMEGVLIFAFSHCKTLAGAIVALVCFSLFVQAAEGSTFGIVPYVEKNWCGSVTGIVGAGGNVGAVAFSLLFRGLGYQHAFLWMGISVIFAASLSGAIWIRGESLMCCRPENIGTCTKVSVDEEYPDEVEALKQVDLTEER